MNLPLLNNEANRNHLAAHIHLFLASFKCARNGKVGDRKSVQGVKMETVDNFERVSNALRPIFLFL